MNGFALKTIAVTALVCFLVDWSRAESVQDHNNDVSMSDKVANIASKVKTGATDALHSLQNTIQRSAHPVNVPIHTEKVERMLSSAKNFFSESYSKFKNSFSSKPNQPSNAKNQELDKAIKAFDDYADTKH